MDTPEDQEQLYRIQLQQAFDLEKWDDAKINSILDELLLTLSSSEDFKKIFNKAKENKNIVEVLTNTGLLNDGDDENSNDDIIFKMLFTYDYFDLVHWCLCDYLTRKSVRPTQLEHLITALQN
jgi:hypothetical protein